MNHLRIKAAKAAYVAGRITVEELEQRIEAALSPDPNEPAWIEVDSGDYAPSEWLVREFHRAFDGRGVPDKPMMLGAGCTFVSLSGDEASPGGIISSPHAQH